MINIFKKVWHYLNVREIAIVNTEDGKKLNKNENAFEISGFQLAFKGNRSVLTHGASKGVTCPEKWFKSIAKTDKNGKQRVDVHFILLENRKRVIVVTEPKKVKN